MEVKIINFLPYWSKNYLIEEIVVKIFGSCETHPFHSERCNEAEENSCSTEYAKSSHVVGLRGTNIKNIWNYQLSFSLLQNQMSKSDNIVKFIIFHQFRQLKGCHFWELGQYSTIILRPSLSLLPSLFFPGLPKGRWSMESVCRFEIFLDFYTAALILFIPNFRTVRSLV